jgi:putative AbiEi antitoxin of type IV toxin-antitoxin system
MRNITSCMAQARGQQGLMTTGQILGTGTSRADLARLVSEGTWTRYRRGLYVVGAVPDTWRQRVMAESLSGGVASHRTAGALLALPGFLPWYVEITVVGGRARPRAGVIMHRTNFLRDWDVITIHGIPATSVARTLLDLSGLVGFVRARRAALDALSRKLVTVPQLDEQMTAAGRMGRPGTAVFRMILAELERAEVLTDSELEEILLDVLEKRGWPAPTCQFIDDEIGPSGGRVDVGYPRCHIGIECDGYDFHAPKPDWHRERSKQNALVSRGWRILRFTSEDARRPGPFLANLERLAADHVRHEAHGGCPLRGLPFL